MKRFVVAYMWVFSLQNEIFECYAENPTDALQQLVGFLFDEFTELDNFGQLFEYFTDKNISISYPYEIVDKS